MTSPTGNNYNKRSSNSVNESIEIPYEHSQDQYLECVKCASMTAKSVLYSILTFVKTDFGSALMTVIVALLQPAFGIKVPSYPMANRPRGYGLTSEIRSKIASKYNVALEQEIRLWMEAVIEAPISTEQSAQMPPGPDRLHKELKDGSALCKVMNIIHPGCIKKINDSKMAFKEMENIGNFLSGCEGLGIAKVDLFATADLHDKTNMVQVINAIMALGRKAQKIGYNGPVLGVKESDSNPRNFTDEQLKAGQGVIGLQMGTNKGASQQGMSFGTTRSII